MYEGDENVFLINRIFVAATRRTRTAERQDRKPYLWQWHKWEQSSLQTIKRKKERNKRRGMQTYIHTNQTKRFAALRPLKARPKKLMTAGSLRPLTVKPTLLSQACVCSSKERWGLMFSLTFLHPVGSVAPHTAQILHFGATSERLPAAMTWLSGEELTRFAWSFIKFRNH